MVQNNIIGKNDGDGNTLENYLSDEIFCNDRTSSSTFPFTTETYRYKPFIRVNNNSAPSFKCPDTSNDGFTLKTSGASSSVTPSGDGNNMLDYPVGLITGDEVAYAGGKASLMNQKFYLFTGSYYWTMSPISVQPSSLFATSYAVTSSGEMGTMAMSNQYGVRPVINLKPGILYSGGRGTEAEPYTVALPIET